MKIKNRKKRYIKVLFFVIALFLIIQFVGSQKVSQQLGITFVSQSPLDNAIWGIDFFEVRVFISAEDKISSCSLIFNGKEEKMTIITIDDKNVDCGIKKTRLEDGIYNYKIRVYLSEGFFETEEITFTVDTSLPQQKIQGKLQAVVGEGINFEVGHYYIFSISADKNYLIVSEDIPLKALNKIVNAEGILVNNIFFADSISLEDSEDSELGAGGSHLDGNQRTFVFLMKYQGSPAEPTNKTAVQDLIFGLEPSVKTFWEENSYNKTILQNLGIHGWWTLPQNTTYYDPQVIGGYSHIILLNDSLQIAKNNGVQIQDDDRIILIFNEQSKSVMWGMGSMGYYYWQTPYGYIKLSVAYIPPSYNPFYVMAHELGHNFDFSHSGGVYTLDYGSVWDVVSSGCGYGSQFPHTPHTIVHNKLKSHWLLGSDFVEVPQVGFFQGVVYPTTDTSGLRAVRLKTQLQDISFTIETRKPEKYDSCLPNHGVIIHIVNKSLFENKLNGIVYGRQEARPIDSTPNDNNLTNAHFVVGENYTNTDYNFVIDVVAQVGNGFLINVYPTCGITLYQNTKLDNDVQCNDTAFFMGADDITLDCDGHTLTGNATGSNVFVTGFGVLSENRVNITIKNCIIQNFTNGIKFYSTNKSFLLNNTALENAHGFGLVFSSGNNLTSNTAKDNDGSGFVLVISNNNVLTKNNAQDNEVGFTIAHTSNNNILKNNRATNNADGFWVQISSNNTFSSNKANENSHGFFLADSSSNNTLNSNIAKRNSMHGFLIARSNENTLINNIANNNNFAGIYLTNSSLNKLLNNKLNNNNNSLGVYLQNSPSNILDSNTALNNNIGIVILSSNNSNLTNNIADNNVFGISLKDSFYNRLENNKANNNSNGIFLSTSNNNIIKTNTIMYNLGFGIKLSKSFFNTLKKNKLSFNFVNIGIDPSNNNNIEDNDITNSNTGIEIIDGNYNLIKHNMIIDNILGMNITSSSNNLIFNNIFNNKNNVQDDGFNFWNISKTSGINIIRGQFLGGNFWSDYTGEDINNDSIGDTNLPYNSRGSIKNGGDFSPLINITKDIIPPIVIIHSPEEKLYNISRILFNISLNERGLCDYTLTNGKKNFTMQTFNNISFSAIKSLADKIYTVRYYCRDLLGNLNGTATRRFSVDALAPVVSFRTRTAADGANVSENWVFIDVKVREGNFANISYGLFNSTSLLNQTTYTRLIKSINFTNLKDGNYTYNVTVFDITNKQGSTPTRKIQLLG